MAIENLRGRCLAACLFAICVATLGCRNGEETAEVVGAATHGSPEDAFGAAKTAIQDKNFEAFANCLTSESQDMMAGGMVMGAIMMKAMAGGLGGALGGEEAQQETGKSFAKIDEVLAKHGVSEDKLAALDSDEGPADPQAAMQQLVAPIQDRAAFLGDVMVAFESLGDGAQRSRGPTQAFGGTLEELNTDGDSATAFVVWTQDDQERRQPIEFKKADGGWLIHLPAKPPAGVGPGQDLSTL